MIQRDLFYQWTFGNVTRCVRNTLTLYRLTRWRRISYFWWWWGKQEQLQSISISWFMMTNILCTRISYSFNKGCFSHFIYCPLGPKYQIQLLCPPHPPSGRYWRRCALCPNFLLGEKCAICATSVRVVLGQLVVVLGIYLFLIFFTLFQPCRDLGVVFIILMAIYMRFSCSRL